MIFQKNLKSNRTKTPLLGFWKHNNALLNIQNKEYRKVKFQQGERFRSQSNAKCPNCLDN